MMRPAIKSFSKLLSHPPQNLYILSKGFPRASFFFPTLTSHRAYRFCTTASEHTPSKEGIARDEKSLGEFLSKGKHAMLKGEYIEAQQLFLLALTLSNRLYGNAGETVGLCYYSLGDIATLRGDKRRARESYLKAYDILIKDRVKYRQQLMNIERAISKVSFEPKTKRRYHEDIKEKRQEELKQLLTENSPENTLKIGILYNHLGSLSQQEGNMEEAIELKKKAQSCFEQRYSKDPSSLFFVYVDMAMFYRLNHSYNEMIEYMQMALKTIESQESEKAQLLRSIGLHNLGKIYMMIEDYEKALDSLLEALGIKEFSDLKEEHVMRDLYHEIGMCYFFMNNSKKSIEFFEKALSVEQRTGEEGFIAQLYQHIAESYLFLERDFVKAKKYLERAYNLRKVYQGDDHEETIALEEILKKVDNVLYPK